MLDDAKARLLKWDRIVQQDARVLRDRAAARERFRLEVERQRKLAVRNGAGKNVLRV